MDENKGRGRPDAQACSSIKSCSTCCKKTRGCWKLQAGRAATGGSAYCSPIRYALTGTRTRTAAEGASATSEIKPSTLPADLVRAQLSVAGAERDLDAAAAMVAAAVRSAGVAYL